MVTTAIVAAIDWFALYFGCVAAASDRRLSRRTRPFRPQGGPSELGDPALVNLVTTGCQPDAAAFATVLHLGDRRTLGAK